MGRELILVAQKFIGVVILMVIFVPTMRFVGLAGGIETFEPGRLDTWGLGMMFWIAATSVFTGASLFIVALVDLVYAMVGIGGIGDASSRKCESPDQNGPCDGCADSDDS